MAKNTDFANMGLEFNKPELNFSVPKIRPLQDPWDEGESPYELMQKSAQNSEKQRKILEEQIVPLKEIADSAKRQADSAEIMAKSAEEHALAANKASFSAKARANLSLVLSAVSVIGVLLANADKIVHNVQKILSYLGLLK